MQTALRRSSLCRHSIGLQRWILTYTLKYMHTYINTHICTCFLSLLRKLSFNISVYTLSCVKFMDPFAGRYLFHLSAATSVLLLLLLHLLNLSRHHTVLDSLDLSYVGKGSFARARICMHTRVPLHRIWK